MCVYFMSGECEVWKDVENTKGAKGLMSPSDGRISVNSIYTFQTSDQPPQERRERREAYDTIRRLYTNAVKATKREIWRDFVTEQAQSNMWVRLIATIAKG